MYASFSRYIVTVIKSRSMEWAGSTTRVGYTRNECKILVKES